MLHSRRFFTGRWDEALQLRDLTWLGADGGEMQAEQWDDDRTLCFGMLLDGRAPRSGIARRGQDASVLLLFNAWHDAVEFQLPEGPAGAPWRRVVDTAATAPDEPGKPAETGFAGGTTYLVTGRSMLVFSRDE